MANDLGILLHGKVDVSTTVAQVNRDIKAIQSQLQGLDLNIDTSKMTNEMKKLNRNMQRQMQNIGQGTGNIGQQLTDSISINMDDLRKNHQQFYNEIDKLKRHYNGTLSSIRKSGGVELTDSREIEKLQKMKVGIRDLNGVLRNFEIRKTQEGSGVDVVGFNEVQNIEKARKQTQKQIEANKKAEAQQRKENQKQKKKTRELEHQLQLAKKQAKMDVQKVRRGYGDSITPEQDKQLNNYLNNMNKLSSTMPNVKQRMASLNKGFKQTTENIKDMHAQTSSLAHELKTALTRVPLWMGAMTAFYAPIRGLQNATEQIITLDTQMTELKRVMDTTPRTYNNLMNQSINLSSELGNKVEEVNKAMIGFARQGYNPETLKDLTKTATIASNISELGTEDSMSAITASMRNFNIEAQDSVRIIDRLNEVNNISLPM